MEIKGVGFTSKTSLDFVGPDASVRRPLSQELIGSDTLVVTLDTPAWPDGFYHLRLRKPGMESDLILEDAFEVYSHAAPGHLKIWISGPRAVRPLRQTTFWINYENDGGTEMPAPIFQFSNNMDAPMRLSKEKPYRKGPIQLLGIPSETPLGTIAPGDVNRLPVYVLISRDIPAGTSILFRVKRLKMDSRLIDWDTLAADLKPDDFQDDAWNLVMGNIMLQMGYTWTDYLESLNRDATYLGTYLRSLQGSLVGDTMSLESYLNPKLYDVSSLLGF
ncbi:MAG: hypothetical protein GY703_01340 [Gammaproteobacteria bacterium]|nr:hypothetical protein [Gammaproteobacteria bacterium]